MLGQGPKHPGFKPHKEHGFFLDYVESAQNQGEEWKAETIWNTKMVWMVPQLHTHPNLWELQMGSQGPFFCTFPHSLAKKGLGDPI